MSPLSELRLLRTDRTLPRTGMPLPVPYEWAAADRKRQQQTEAQLAQIRAEAARRDKAKRRRGL